MSADQSKKPDVYLEDEESYYSVPYGPTAEMLADTGFMDYMRLKLQKDKNVIDCTSTEYDGYLESWRVSYRWHLPVGMDGHELAAADEIVIALKKDRFIEETDDCAIDTNHELSELYGRAVVDIEVITQFGRTWLLDQWIEECLTDVIDWVKAWPDKAEMVRAIYVEERKRRDASAAAIVAELDRALADRREHQARMTAIRQWAADVASCNRMRSRAYHGE